MPACLFMGGMIAFMFQRFPPRTFGPTRAAEGEFIAFPGGWPMPPHPGGWKVSGAPDVYQSQRLNEIPASLRHIEDVGLSDRIEGISSRKEGRRGDS